MEDTVQQDAPASAASAAPNYTSIVADIVSAFVSNNLVRPQELPELIASVHASIVGIENGAKAEPEPAKREPAVSIKKSLGDDYLISLLDGKKYRTLKRHIGKHGMTPEEYREEFGLPATYPMVAPAYSARRSALAKEIGLGNARGDEARSVKLAAKKPSKRSRPREDAA